MKLNLFKRKKETPQEGPVLWGPGGVEVIPETHSSTEVTHMFNIPIRPEGLPGKGMIWTVQSSTTVATNLAAALAAGNPERVVLVDLDGIGSVRSRMGLKESLETILDWQDVRDARDLQRVLINHTSGVLVVPGVMHYDHISLVDAGLIFNMLTILKERFDHIVLDCPPVGMNNNTWAAALVSNIVALIIKPERTNLDFIKDNLVFLKRLGCEERTCVILNHAGAPGSIKATDLIGNKQLGLDIHHTLPYSVSVAEASNKREIVLLTKPRDEFSTALKKLVEKLEGGR